MYATRFGPFSVYHQTFKYNNHLKEDTMKYNVCAHEIQCMCALRGLPK